MSRVSTKMEWENRGASGKIKYVGKKIDKELGRNQHNRFIAVLHSL